MEMITHFVRTYRLTDSVEHGGNGIPAFAWRKFIAVCDKNTVPDNAEIFTMQQPVPAGWLTTFTAEWREDVPLHTPQPAYLEDS